MKRSDKYFQNAVSFLRKIRGKNGLVLKEKSKTWDTIALCCCLFLFDKLQNKESNSPHNMGVFEI